MQAKAWYNANIYTASAAQVANTNEATFGCISPVYVTAIKRGGGVLLASFASMFFFKEPLAGRGFPIAAIVAGVVALCL